MRNYVRQYAYELFKIHPAMILVIASFIFLSSICQHQAMNFPGKNWKESTPAAFGMDKDILDSLVVLLGGRGCVVKNGTMVWAWGDQAEKSDWLSSVKPVFSTLLFFAVEEGKIPGVHYKIQELGWDLKPKDREMEFFHLANMISGYALPEKPGEAWAYNDFAIQLYHKSLFDKLFKESPDDILLSRMGSLQFQDHPSFREDVPRFYASVRDFARIGLFWLNKGYWKGDQLLPAKYFDLYMKPQTPPNLPHTNDGKTDDYLQIGSFGGGADHFTEYGAGIYGFNWWFNELGRLHPDNLTWPDAPEGTIMTIGAGGNNLVMIPELNLILASARGNWGQLEAGNPKNTFNLAIKYLVSADKNW